MSVRGQAAIGFQQRLNELFDRALAIINEGRDRTLPSIFPAKLHELVEEAAKFDVEIMAEERDFDPEERIELDRLIIASARTLRTLKEWLDKHPLS